MVFLFMFLRMSISYFRFSFPSLHLFEVHFLFSTVLAHLRQSQGFLCYRHQIKWTFFKRILSYLDATFTSMKQNARIIIGTQTLKQISPTEIRRDSLSIIKKSTGKQTKNERINFACANGNAIKLHYQPYWKY